MWINIDKRIEGGFIFTCSKDFPKFGTLRFEVYRTWSTGEILMLHRVFTRDKLAAMIRIDYWWYDLCVGLDTFVSPLNPIRAEEVEVCCERPEAWLKDALLEVGGIGRGTFFVEKVEGRRLEQLLEEEVVAQGNWYESHTKSLVPLRAASKHESGRVKWYRKLARSGELPPVFAYRYEGLLSSLVLDGHDRLLAAKLEGVQPEIWEISRVRIEDRTVPPEKRAAVELSLIRELAKKGDGKDEGRIWAINWCLRDIYGTQTIEHRSEVGVIPGGLETWRSEVSRLSLPDYFCGDMFRDDER